MHANDGRHVQRDTLTERAARSVRLWLAVFGTFVLCFGCERLTTAAEQDTATFVSPTPTAIPAKTPRPTPPSSPTPFSPSPKPTPPPTKTTKPPPPEPETDPSFETCRDAIAEGFGPYVQGEDPEYDWYDDRDEDGVVCEEPDSDDDEQEPAEEPEPESDTDPRFDTCGEANDAGYGPYVRGQDPEYDWYQDRDNDGIVCER